MAKYRHHKYIWSKPFGTARHHWELVGPRGGLHFHVSVYQGQPSAGLEIHSISSAGDDAPDHVNCPLTGGRCWHDGTSLYAVEHLWPMIEGYLRSGDHDDIFHLLEGEANRRFDTPKEGE